MELWIRSQDKESLTKVSNVQYTYIEGNLYTDVREKHFIGTNNDEFQILGRYETKERALEVLDEIQNLLQPKIKYIQEEPVESIVDFGYQITQNVDVKIQEINRIVYKMPEE